jgi:hypothetical protein
MNGAISRNGATENIGFSYCVRQDIIQYPSMQVNGMEDWDTEIEILLTLKKYVTNSMEMRP